MQENKMLEVCVLLNPTLDKETITDIMSKVSSLFLEIKHLTEWNKRNIIIPKYKNKAEMFIIQGFIEDIPLFEQELNKIEDIVRCLICEVPLDIRENIDRI